MKKRYLPILAVAAMLAITACRNGNGNGKPQDAASTEASTKRGTADTGADEPRIEFSMTDINGDTVAVTDEFARHKITIVDFWASWCGPCMQEMPNLVKTYNAYKDKGLGIIGVSLDEDKGHWTEAVNSMGMSWTQLSDLQGWDNSAARKYGISSIPFTVVVDGTGKVLTAGLRGEELEAYIAQYFAGTGDAGK